MWLLLLLFVVLQQVEHGILFLLEQDLWVDYPARLLRELGEDLMVDDFDRSSRYWSTAGTERRIGDADTWRRVFLCAQLEELVIFG